jgi:acetyltransferase-like isoleucine patch superfamily enzyme
VNYSYIRSKIGIWFSKFRTKCLRRRGYDIAKLVRIERGCNFDRSNPKGIHIGEGCLITSHVTILSHYSIPKNDSEKFVGQNTNTYIGKGCFIGVGAIILAGIKLGDYCVVGAGSVVTKDVPSNCIVVGNPARVIKSNIIMHDIIL